MPPRASSPDGPGSGDPGTLLTLSTFLTAASLALYTLAPCWVVVVSAGALSGLGAGAIDAGINADVARRHGTRMLGLLHAFYGLGATIGPWLMARAMKGSSYRCGHQPHEIGRSTMIVAGFVDHPA